MEVIEKRNYVHDIEVYPNYFLVIFIEINIDTGWINKYIAADIKSNYTICDEKKTLLNNNKIHIFKITKDSEYNLIHLIRFINDNVAFLIGFNNLRYDELIIRYVLLNITKFKKGKVNSVLYQLSQDIINTDNIYYDHDLKILTQFGVSFVSIDLLAMGFEWGKRRSLKQASINLKWYRIQDLPYRFNKILNNIEVEEVTDYCINDVLSTLRMYKHLREAIKLRLAINSKYELKPFESVLNKTKSGIADVILAKLYSKYSGEYYNSFKDKRTYYTKIKVQNCISDKITFKNPELKKLVAKLRTLEITSTKGELKFKIKAFGLEFKIGAGGLHSDDKPAKFNNKNYILKDVDVISYYTSVVINNSVSPKHLNKDAWLKATEFITNDRKRAKREGDSITASTLKITINSGGFGKMGFENHWVYDREAMVKVTINGQLFLLMLIEWLTEAGFEVISANTDGVITKIPRDREEVFDSICRLWEDATKFSLESTYYKLYIRKDINNYFTIKEDNTLKVKGSFNERIDLEAGYAPPVLAIAWQEYFRNGIKPETTIFNHIYTSPDAIYDYCDSPKVKKTFKIIYTELVNNVFTTKSLQHSNRFYVCTKGGYIFKDYVIPQYTVDSKGRRKRKKPVSLKAGFKVTLFNNYFAVNNVNEYNIDYKYYIDMVYKVINKIEKGKQLNLFNYEK